MDRDPRVIAAIIAGVFAVVAACIGAVATIGGGAWVLMEPEQQSVATPTLPPRPEAKATATPTLVATTPVAASASPTATDLPTSTPQPATATITPSPEPSATPAKAPVFSDDFETGMSPSWRIDSGEPVVVNGQLTGEDNARLRLDINLPAAYSIELRTWVWEAWWSRAWEGDMLFACIEDDSRIIALGWGRFDFQWLTYEGKEWQAIPGSYDEDHDIPDGTELRVTVSEGVYTLYIDGEKASSVVNRGFTCNRVGLRFGEGVSKIDDFVIREYSQ